ncbi:hypothetical protein [Nitrosospira sp. Is2]|uniref:hypothetical protein n=1 Tax=Nitrosospira sp. Is2 TaxID=3080532 RepID=UPI0029555CC9|nr:hypothetical protein [Nitrosospira sp. Is2]WON74051.1 hypothetical protein R5L00_00740 [Nitrosospira sp. Is2]
MLSRNHFELDGARPLVEVLIKRRAAAKQGDKDLSNAKDHDRERMDGKRERSVDGEQVGPASQGDGEGRSWGCEYPPAGQDNSEYGGNRVSVKHEAAR